jgi:hypothetical protein
VETVVLAVTAELVSAAFQASNHQIARSPDREIRR